MDLTSPTKPSSDTDRGTDIIQWPCSPKAGNDLWSGSILSYISPTPAPTVSITANPTSASVSTAALKANVTYNTSCTSVNETPSTVYVTMSVTAPLFMESSTNWR